MTCGWARAWHGWLLELGNFYVHWNAPPGPSLWVGWMGRRHIFAALLADWRADEEEPSVTGVAGMTDDVAMLQTALRACWDVLGPVVVKCGCESCHYEWGKALDILREIGADEDER